MPASKNPAMYTDCHQVLEQALAKGGLKVRFTTTSRASHFRMRLNSYRVALRHHQMQGKPQGFVASTPYDHFMFRLSDTMVIIEERVVNALSIEDLDGNATELKSVPAREDDTDEDLLNDATDIVNEIRRTGRIDLD
jgi:hypothetical protein